MVCEIPLAKSVLILMGKAWLAGASSTVVLDASINNITDNASTYFLSSSSLFTLFVYFIKVIAYFIKERMLVKK